MFRAWSDHKACSKAIKVLVFDGSKYEDWNFVDFVRQSSPSIYPLSESDPIPDLKSRRWYLELEEMMEILVECKEDATNHDWKAARAYAELVGRSYKPRELTEYKSLVEGYQICGNLQGQEKNARHSEELLRVLMA